MDWSHNIPDLVRPPQPWCFNADELHNRLHIKSTTINGRKVRLQEKALHNLVTKVVPNYRQELNRPIVVISSYRSCREQCRICHEHGDANCSGINGIVAAPGYSGHQLAVCVDLQPPPPRLIPAYRRIMEHHGWQNFSGSSGSDPNHWNALFNG